MCRMRLARQWLQAHHFLRQVFRELDHYPLTHAGQNIIEAFHSFGGTALLLSKPNRSGPPMTSMSTVDIEMLEQYLLYVKKDILRVVLTSLSAITGISVVHNSGHQASEQNTLSTGAGSDSSDIKQDLSRSSPEISSSQRQPPGRAQNLKVKTSAEPTPKVTAHQIFTSDQIRGPTSAPRMTDIASSTNAATPRNTPVHEQTIEATIVTEPQRPVNTSAETPELISNSSSLEANLTTADTAVLHNTSHTLQTLLGSVDSVPPDNPNVVTESEDQPSWPPPPDLDYLDYSYEPEADAYSQWAETSEDKTGCATKMPLSWDRSQNIGEIWIRAMVT